jgi:DNA-binding LytR/AlgR family response regulator
MLQALHNEEARPGEQILEPHTLPATTWHKRTRMVVKKGTGYVLLKLEDIVVIYTENKITYVVDRDGKKYVGERNLTEVEATLDKSMFFRANRQFIVNIEFIRSYKTYEKVKLQVELTLSGLAQPIIVSQETAPLFRDWVAEA